jgi:DNA-binding beta-propeller fold protein YncE
MDYLLFVYKWTSRDLRKIIVVILKSWVANEVKKVNYIQNYMLKDVKNVVKTEEKLLLINTWNENKLNEFLLNNFPQIERVKIN